MMHRNLTIEALTIALLAATNSSLWSQTHSPEHIFALFVKLDSQGAQLTSDGWQEVAALFVTPGAPRRSRIFVTDGGGPGRPTPEGKKVGFVRDYLQFGHIELPQLHFSAADGSPGGAHLRAGFDLVKVSGPNGELEWRIEGPVPEPVVTIDAAIRYVIEVRANTKDAVLRNNADRTLAALRRLR